MGYFPGSPRHLSYFGFGRDSFWRALFLCPTAWSNLGHMVLTSLPDRCVPLPAAQAWRPQELIPMAEGMEGLVLGKSGTTSASPWGSLGEDCVSALRKPFQEAIPAPWNTGMLPQALASHGGA